MSKINTTANMGWLKSVQQTAAETPAASHRFVGFKAEESFWDHEVTLARPAAAGIIMKGNVQPHTCIYFSAMTQICRPHSVVSFNHPGNSSLHMLCRRFSMHPFREIFICIFFFPKTVLLRNSFAHLLLSTVIQAKGLLWKWESFLPVNCSNTMTRSMQPSSLYKLLLLNYLSCLVFFPIAKAGDTRLAQTHHLRLIRSFRVQRPIQKIKTKLLVEYANWDSIQNLYAALLFYFQLGGLYVPISVARVILCGHLEVSCCGTE